MPFAFSISATLQLFSPRKLRCRYFVEGEMAGNRTSHGFSENDKLLNSPELHPSDGQPGGIAVEAIDDSHANGPTAV
jgi:hypothetical protein